MQATCGALSIFLPETHQAEQEVQAGYWAVLIVVGLKLTLCI